MHGITVFIVRRLLLGLLTLFFASLIIIGATQALPGDAARSILGRAAQPESLASLRHQLGLDKPVWQQYWEWISGVFTGDLGSSLANGLAVTDVLGERLLYSTFLMLIAAAIRVPIASGLEPGMVELNGQVVTVTVVDADEFTIGISTSSYTAYTSGGLAFSRPTERDTLTWAGTFDVPVRFLTDWFRARSERAHGEWDEIEVIELS